MTTSQTPSPPQSPPEAWQQAMTSFRARAQSLFEAQRERIRCLEASIAGQLENTNGDGTAEGASTELLPSADAAQQEELRAELAQCRELLNTRAEELKQLRAQVAEQAGADEALDVASLLEDVSELKTERDELIARLAQTKQQLERAAEGDSGQLDELRKRFEMAVQEIRELKSKNEELQQQAEFPSTSAPSPSPAGAFDWEQQKLRLMQQLDDDAEASISAEDRLTAENTIRITDQVVADKDREIQALKEMLEQQPAQGDDESSSLAAVSKILDSDEVIREERDKLSKLQDEWREKLRKAEIDISVERAKLARERTELDEKMRALEEAREAAGTNEHSSPEGKKTSSGRWLSRLGLTDDGN